MPRSALVSSSGYVDLREPVASGAHQRKQQSGLWRRPVELTDGDGRANRLRYRWNRVRWADPNGHLAKAEPPGPPRRARLGQPLCTP